MSRWAVAVLIGVERSLSSLGLQLIFSQQHRCEGRQSPPARRPPTSDQIPAAQDTCLRLTVLEGLWIRTAAERLEISATSVSHCEVRLPAQRAQEKAIAALRQHLEAAG